MRTGIKGQGIKGFVVLMIDRVQYKGGFIKRFSGKGIS
jgi:hypothetical protein